ncbi:hypothetical protein HOG21_02060 [bacterium]|nr:hypothetical protein [bacterium]
MFHTSIDFSIIHLSTICKLFISKSLSYSKSHKFKLAYFNAFHNFVTNFCPFFISNSSKAISLHRFHQQAQYLTESDQYFSINFSGVAQALFFDLLIFSHFGAST